MEPKIIISPETALIDEKVEILLEGFQPGQQVTLRATTDNILGITAKWISEATFTVPESGRINLSKQDPTSGSYKGVDAMGLFWSMNLTKLAKLRKPERIKDTPLFPSSVIKFEAVINKAVVASATCTRLYFAENITVKEVDDPEIVGRYFFNPEGGSQPTIIVLGGQESNLEYAQLVAGLLASHGYTTLALAYFGLDKLSATLSKIPLEYLRNAIDWLYEQPEVMPESLGIWGTSKGGELALLIGSRFREVRTVVACNPSSIIFQGLDNSFGIENSSSWTWLGKQMPYIRLKGNFSMLKVNTFFKLAFKKPVRFDNIYLESIEGIKPSNSAVIPVEHTSGPILLISGQDDAYWPSQKFCSMAEERLKQKGFKHKVAHYSYANTGHNINPPYLPTTILQLNGGKADQNALASEDAWQKALDFLQNSLKTASSKSTKAATIGDIKQE